MPMPRHDVRDRGEVCYVYGFVRPTTGESWRCFLPTLSMEAFKLALTTFAAEEGIGPVRCAVLVLDQAGRQNRPRLPVREEIHLAPLRPPPSRNRRSDQCFLITL